MILSMQLVSVTGVTQWPANFFQNLFSTLVQQKPGYLRKKDQENFASNNLCEGFSKYWDG